MSASRIVELATQFSFDFFFLKILMFASGLSKTLFDVDFCNFSVRRNFCRTMKESLYQREIEPVEIYMGK